MNASKNIRVYGTLLNYTLDPAKSNGTVAIGNDYHNDAIAYAYQLYDSRFFPGQDTVDNYQDRINKRLTAISYADTGGGVTTIGNRDGSKGNPYVLVVNGHTNIKGDLHVDGDIYYKDGNGNEHKFDLADLISRLEALEGMWQVDPSDNTKLVAKSNRSAVANKFFDTDPAIQ